MYVQPKGGPIGGNLILTTVKEFFENLDPLTCVGSPRDAQLQLWKNLFTLAIGTLPDTPPSITCPLPKTVLLGSALPNDVPLVDNCGSFTVAQTIAANTPMTTLGSNS